MNEKQPPANGERQDPSKLADRLQEKLSRILTERPFEYAWWRQSALQERRIQTNPELSKDGETSATERTIFLTGPEGEYIAVFGVVHDSRPVVLGPTVAIMAPDSNDWVVYRCGADANDKWQVVRTHGTGTEQYDGGEEYTFFQPIEGDSQQHPSHKNADAQELRDLMKLIDTSHCRTETPPKSKETEALLDWIKKLREEAAYWMELVAERLYLR